MKMNVRDALAYAVKGDGMEYSEEKYDKLYKFLKGLPHNPNEVEHFISGVTFYIKDYKEGWFAQINLHHDKEKIYISMPDGDMMDKSDTRVKCNYEALKLMKELSEVKWAYDIDKHWNMSDDHRYWNKMNKIDEDARFTTRNIYSQL
jgi:hypothetical protein